MRLTVHDPDHLALRRGIRAAIALPLSLATALYVLDDTQGVLFAIFGTVGLLINADFAGNTVQRLGSYLLTGAAGTVAIVLGWAASFSTPLAVVMTLLVAFALSFLNLMRGAVAVGTPAVLLLFVVAVSLESTASSLGPYLLGWSVAVVISTVTALLVLPHDRRAGLRLALGDAFEAAAHGAEVAWQHPDASATRPFADFDAAVDRLDGQYGGQPFRTAGLTTKDQALTLLVDHVNSLRLLLEDPQHTGASDGTISIPGRVDLVQAIIAGLRDLAAAARDPRHLPTGAGIDDARIRLTAGMEHWVLARSQAGDDPQSVADEVGADHLMRMCALVVEQMVELARLVNGGTIESLERQPPIPVRHRWDVVRAQVSWNSPWLRNSIRSAVGLSIAVLVINITGVAHGFWVLIGVISILRFDAVGTRRFALLAVLGTIVGVIVASVIVLNVDSATILWILLPMFVFLAAWSAVAVNYPVGQAAFSALILVAFGIVSWPPDVITGVTRIEDVALGAAVALVVGLLMWPRGAVGALRHRLAASIRSASGYMSSALSGFTAPIDDEELRRRRHDAVGDAERAAETYDMALMQRGPAEDMHPWTRATTAAYLLISAGRVVAHFARTTPTVREHPALHDAIDSARRESEAHWAAVADAVDDEGQDPSIPAPPPPAAYPTLPQVASTEDARALIVAVWVIDWVHHLDRLTSGRLAGERQLA